MALVVVDFTFLQGNDNEWIVKKLAVADCQTNRVSSFLFKSPHPWKELSAAQKKKNSELVHGTNWNDGYILCSELKNLLK
jgi:hypothetical protein